jgi:phage tail-like protein
VSASPPTNSLRDVRIELCNEAGEPIQCWKLFRCRVSEFQALPDLDARANEISIEYLKFEQECSADG